MSLEITTLRRHDTTIYIADIVVENPLNIRTALAQNKYGRNITQKTSSMASEHGAIFAVNGDYYGARTDGFVVRNGTLYRSTENSSASGQALIMNTSGNLVILEENETTKAELIAASPWHAWSFGPALIKNGTIAVNSSSEVNQSSSSNPRTGIGQIDVGHYVLIVSDGRLTTEAGLTLLELAQEFALLGCQTAYNLDGGGSSTMWFNGSIINQPVNSGTTISERSVSDCVYLGYQ
jgi:exopolysaccharide biosynthesis protein